MSPISTLLFFANLLLITCVTLIESPQALETAISTSDKLTAVLFCSSSVRKCLFIEDIYLNFAKRVEGLINVYSLDCDALTQEQKEAKNMFLCLEQNQGDLPILTFFEPNPNNTNSKLASRPLEHTYEGTFELESLVFVGTKLMPNFRDEINNDDQLKEFLNDPIPSKVILLNAKKEILPIFKALTAEYRDRIKFGEIPKKLTKMTRSFTESEAPTLVMLKKGSEGYYQKEIYSDNFELKKLEALLKPLALSEKFQPEHAIEFINVTRKNIEKEVNKVEGFAMIHIFDNETYADLDEITSKFKTLFTYFNFNCTNSKAKKFVQETFKFDTLPSLIVLAPGDKQDLIYDLHFAKFKTPVEITKEISDMIGDNTKSVRSDQLQELITNVLLQKKPINVLFHNSREISMSYRALSKIPKYENKIVFSNVKNPTKEVLEAFGVQRLPSLITMFLDPSQGNSYSADPEFAQLTRFKGKYVYHELEEFFDTTMSYLTTSSNKIKEIRTQEDLKEACAKDYKICVIGFLNGYKQSKEDEQALQMKLAALRAVAQRYPDFNFCWIDAICHVESLRDLGLSVEKIPALIVYNYNGDVFGRMENRNFDEENIHLFVDAFTRNSVTLKPIYDPITVQTKDCDDIHKRMSQGYQGIGQDQENTKEKKYYTDEL